MLPAKQVDVCDDEDDGRNDFFIRIQERMRRAGIVGDLNEIVFEKLSRYTENEIMTAIDKTAEYGNKPIAYVIRILENREKGKEKMLPVVMVNLKNQLRSQHYSTERDYSAEEINRAANRAWREALEEVE